MPTRLDDVKSRVSALRAEVLRIQPGLTAPASRTPSVFELAAQEALAKAGGDLTEAWFGRRGIGSRATRALLRGQRSAQTGEQQSARRAQAQAFVDQVKTEVDALRGAMDERTRRGLARALAEARNAQRPDTILRRCSGVMDRVLAYEPQVAKPERSAGPSEDYMLLQNLEKTTRILLVSKLSALTSNWWVERVPADVRVAAEQRKRRREATWPWSTGESSDPIEYVDFADYAKIISRRDNWRDAFEKMFHDPEALRTKLRELEPIRNDIAHNRVLSRAAQDKLHLYARDLLASMEN